MITSKKIVLIGPFGVGKSSLIQRFVENTFSENYKVTIGVHISKKVVEVNESESVSLIIWDLEGQNDILNNRSSYLLGTNAFIYVFDLTRPETFSNLEKEINFLKENFKNIPIKVVGNKSDLTTKAHLVQYNGIFDGFVDYFISAKTGSRVESLFSKLAKQLI